MKRTTMHSSQLYRRMEDFEKAKKIHIDQAHVYAVANQDPHSIGQHSQRKGTALRGVRVFWKKPFQVYCRPFRSSKRMENQWTTPSTSIVKQVWHLFIKNWKITIKAHQIPDPCLLTMQNYSNCPVQTLYAHLI